MKFATLLDALARLHLVPFVNNLPNRQLLQVDGESSHFIVTHHVLVQHLHEERILLHAARQKFILRVPDRVHAVVDHLRLLANELVARKPEHAVRVSFSDHVHLRDIASLNELDGEFEPRERARLERDVPLFCKMEDNVEACPLLDIWSWVQFNPLVLGLARNEPRHRKRRRPDDFVRPHLVVVVNVNLEIIAALAQRDLEVLVPLRVERFLDVTCLVLLFKVQTEAEHDVRVRLPECVHLRDVVGLNSAHVNDHVKMK